MKTELKKGDRCHSEWGIATVIENREESRYVDIKTSDGESKIALESELVKIGNHAERMQKMISTAFDAENRYQDDDHITVRVGELAEFVRHYLAMEDSIKTMMARTKDRVEDALSTIEYNEKLLKGEL